MLFKDDFKLFVYDKEYNLIHTFECWSKMIDFFTPDDFHSLAWLKSDTKDKIRTGRFFIGTTFNDTYVMYNTYGYFFNEYKKVDHIIVDQYGRNVRISDIIDDVYENTKENINKPVSKKTFQYNRRWNSRYYFKYRCDPVPFSGKRDSNYYRNSSIFSHKEASLYNDKDHYKYSRKKRKSLISYACWWDDGCHKSNCNIKNWKNYRKTQYKTKEI